MTTWKIDRLLNMDPIEFEHLVASMFSQAGYRAEVTQSSRDRGIDIGLSIEKYGISHQWAVQAKRYREPVGVKEIREYSSLRYRDNTDGVIIVTTSAFTKDAQTEASKHSVKLIDGGLLIKMLDHYLSDVKPEPEISENAAALTETHSKSTETILKSNEKKILAEHVIIDGQRYTITLTNKNIFIRHHSGGIFSKRTQLSSHICIKDVIGIYHNLRNVFIVIGSDRIEVICLKSRNSSRIADTIKSLDTSHSRGEHLLKFEKLDDRYLIMTNRRLVLINFSGQNRKEIKIKNIVGSQIESRGLFRKKRLVVSESSNGIERHTLKTNNPHQWHQIIRETVSSF
ncbi:restriction endonuclease [Methanosalsum zhilinae DSM 4017]|uniref:Restriction endonuclease n=1 Tax=Methanosalsum zhilinae (strain DSM 4017 / NBRC 107636 / OCM 62 / WeN5) TaxID=679901 RepID=F7XPC3_METZD|nr:restriction endonuclease [Methanosalsum zhilinae]AEH60250.1 restriction endonuclease [Methanosalsum zhilinae DSM 4017]